MRGRARPVAMAVLALATGLGACAAGEGPFPAVVQLHGCGGLEAQSYRWARWLAEHGYVALVVDSFGPRGAKADCRSAGPDEPPITARFDDAFGALRYLQSLPSVRADRI